MGLTEELIKYCRKSLGELERIIANSEVQVRLNSQETHKEWLDWRFYEKAKSMWNKWHSSLNYRLDRLDIPTVPYPPFGKLTSFAGFEPALKSVQRLADGGTIEALEALCQLAVFSGRAIRTLRRAQYVREHPYPWQKKAGSAAPEEVTDSEVSKMLGELGDIAPDERD